MKEFRFQKMHPITLSLYFIEALITCFVADKTGLLVIFGALFVFAFMQKRVKTILWSLPLAGFLFLLNPVFYHGGETVLFSLKGVNYTLEAVENGIYCALLILCTNLIFTVLGNILSEDKFLYVFGRILPKTALMIAMIFKHFDLLSESYKQCKNMAQTGGIYENDKTLFQKLKTNAVIFEAFTGAALEGSIDTALSLSAKGYYNKNKTRLKLYTYRPADLIFSLLSSALFACTFFRHPLHFSALALLFGLALLCRERGECV